MSLHIFDPSGLPSPLSTAADTGLSAPRGGTVCHRRLGADPEQEYYLYVPTRCAPGAPVLVSVHGVSRNAAEHAEGFAPFAEAWGVVVVAPYFDEARHPNYQRLGRAGRGQRSDRALDAILAEVSGLANANTDRLYFFGYSGGAQFAHRYAFAYPERVAAMVLGAAGWYTFPDKAVRYPYGIKRPKALPGLGFDPRQFLGIPTFVLVGARDNTRDEALNKSPRIDEQQGRTRLERGKRWIEAMRRAAEAHGIVTPMFFDVVPRLGHSFDRLMTEGQIGPRVFCLLFGAAGLQPARVHPVEPGIRQANGARPI